MNIAPATAECASGIARVHIQSWQAAYSGILDRDFLASLSIEERTLRWRNILQKKESQTLIAQLGERIVGFISFGRCRDEGASPELGEIWALYAKPDVWGRGIGRALLQRAMQELKSSGHNSVSLWVLSQNQRGITFYEAAGFRRASAEEKQLDLGGRQVQEIRLEVQLEA